MLLSVFGKTFVFIKYKLTLVWYTAKIAFTPIFHSEIVEYLFMISAIEMNRTLYPEQRNMDTNANIETQNINNFPYTSVTKSTRLRIGTMAAPLLLALVGCAALLLAARPNATTQDSRGKPVSIASESTPFGMSMFRLWSNGDIEVMVLGQNNIWSDWQSVAPNKSGYAPSNNP